MTGEVTLQGRVLPIGGVKQKVLAAHRAGLKEVILPERNGADLEDVPESVRAEMAFHLASEIDQRSEEHTSELQSRQYLVCRLLLEKKKYIRRLIAYPGQTVSES